MARAREALTVGAMACVILLSLTCPSALGRDVKLVICPQKAPAEAGKYALLPPQASLTDGDAADLYEKAVKALPADTDWDQINNWLAMPLDQLPLKEVQAALEHHKKSLDGVARAARCRECKWPKLTLKATMAGLPPYRLLGFAVRLLARYEIARGNHEGAVLAMQTGFGMCRHLAQAPTLIQCIVGVAIGRMMRAEVEEFVQGKQAPNLYAALVALPNPLADADKAIQSDRKALSSRVLSVLGSKQVNSELEESYDRVRETAKRLDSDLAAIQCVEAIRSYAASHDGQLPQTLGEITEVSVPNDPISGEAFRYTRTGSTAVLESDAPPNGDKKKDALRYEITVKN
jgi:hypothetical protein